MVISFRAASCNNCESTELTGSCTYRTTEPLMKDSDI